VSRATSSPGKTIVVAGAGGNIGSHLVSHLVRMPGVGRLVLVDGDSYSEGNLWTQNIRRRDLGRPKVAALRAMLREIDGGLTVEAIAAFVEDVPLGRLRGDVLLGCVDSKAARRTLNTIAARLAIPFYLDAGVNGDALLARLSVYRPSLETPCSECEWDEIDYSTAEQELPCAGSERSAVATNAPSSLGALAATLQALECRKILTGAADVAADHEIVVGAGTHRMLVSTLTRNPRCRFDHGRWDIQPLGASVDACSVAEALERGRRTLDTAEPVALAVPGQLFATRLSCLPCRSARTIAPYLFARLGPVAAVCPTCAGALELGGFDARDELVASELAPDLLQSPLGALGLRPGDVIRVSDRQRNAYFECGGPR
jgi:molybdopterin/thiamine biosynthesis adenylyltransferase